MQFLRMRSRDKGGRRDESIAPLGRVPPDPTWVAGREYHPASPCSVAQPSFHFQRGIPPRPAWNPAEEPPDSSVLPPLLLERSPGSLRVGPLLPDQQSAPPLGNARLPVDRHVPGPLVRIEGNRLLGKILGFSPSRTPGKPVQPGHNGSPAARLGGEDRLVIAQTRFAHWARAQRHHDGQTKGPGKQPSRLDRRHDFTPCGFHQEIAGKGEEGNLFFLPSGQGLTDREVELPRGKRASVLLASRKGPGPSALVG